MNEKDFVSLCKKTVAEYANQHLDKDKLNGNGFLDDLMHTINHQLEVRAK